VNFDELKQKGAPIDISDSACEGVLSNALDLLLHRKLIDVEDSLLRAEENALVLLAYYANSISCWK